MQPNCSGHSLFAYGIRAQLFYAGGYLFKPESWTLPYFPKYSDIIGILKYELNIFCNLYIYIYIKIACKNDVDLDQTPRSAASNLGLYCLLFTACHNTSGKYGTIYINYN